MELLHVCNSCLEVGELNFELDELQVNHYLYGGWFPSIFLKKIGWKLRGEIGRKVLWNFDEGQREFNGPCDLHWLSFEFWNERRGPTILQYDILQGKLLLIFCWKLHILMTGCWLSREGLTRHPGALTESKNTEIINAGARLMSFPQWENPLALW